MLRAYYKIYRPKTWLFEGQQTGEKYGERSLRYIQELLGHKSSKTTEIYTHVSTRSICQIKSPFDDL